ncbi:MAG TPA: aminomethyl-transferring glycine dehydrogenase subunit GcvPB, partial [Burkholderiales bacterium]|nr:aminomethyl-transferring glycine dehydrogenase subunit GcvPB [Burkholderiales bacterium]
MLIFERSRPGRRNRVQAPVAGDAGLAIPERFLRRSPPWLPEVSELDAVRHYTALSQRNYSVDTHFYPLGSCTMKYNPRVCNHLAMLAPFLERHPAAPDGTGQGFLACMFELQQMLAAMTGMAAVSLAP